MLHREFTMFLVSENEESFKAKVKKYPEEFEVVKIAIKT